MRRALVLTLAAASIATAVSAQTPQPLSLKDAERQALDNNPTIRAGRYTALAATEGIREARSVYFPTTFGSFTAAGAQDGTRIAAGSLNNPTILDRFAAGFSVSQLVTD